MPTLPELISSMFYHEGCAHTHSPPSPPPTTKKQKTPAVGIIVSLGVLIAPLFACLQYSRHCCLIGNHQRQSRCHSFCSSMCFHSDHARHPHQRVAPSSGVDVLAADKLHLVVVGVGDCAPAVVLGDNVCDGCDGVLRGLALPGKVVDWHVVLEHDEDGGLEALLRNAGKLHVHGVPHIVVRVLLQDGGQLRSDVFLYFLGASNVDLHVEVLCVSRVPREI
mmetsp:Transcript_26501/g.74501  ORF Transcript_26501/g.74501 Transcript_26501/m.74501 type:complete len:221 (+) Transcript_26501:239-901(+)